MFGYNLTFNELLIGFHYFHRQDAKLINWTEVIFRGLKVYIQIVTRAYPSCPSNSLQVVLLLSDI